jgi:formate-dependent nitrite reductase cytochrome c552 subunit
MTVRVFVVVLLGGAVAVTFQSCARSSKDVGSRTNALPPLLVDKDAPLLLDEPLLSDEPTEIGKHTTRAQTNNATCFVCHANYAEEPFAQRHAKADIGCSDCHGESIAHKNDENHTTPPDKMYPAGDIDPACRKCHSSHDVPALKVVSRWKERIGDEKTDVLCKECHESHDFPAAKVVRKWQERTGQKEQVEPITCTDCHGNHRLKLRSVRWDKKTGILLPGNKSE